MNKPWSKRASDRREKQEAYKERSSMCAKKIAKEARKSKGMKKSKRAADIDAGFYDEELCEYFA